MTTTKRWDLLIKNVRVVRPGASSVEEADIAITGEKFSKVGTNLPADEAKTVYDGKGLLAFPGVVDAHMHTGIYSPLAEDAVTESRAAAQGGVTSSLNYFRTGQYYLNKGGPYREFLPRGAEDLGGQVSTSTTAITWRRWTARTSREIPKLVEKHGVSSFKIFMFYGSHGLHGRSDSQREFLMIGPDERYDFAHFEFVMRGVQAAREQYPKQGVADQPVAALRDRRDHDRLHEDRGRRQEARRPRRLQRLAAAALRRPGGLHRRLSRQRNGAAQHQSAASVLAQGAERGAADGRRCSRTSISGAR